jgi:plasmid stabilization system protein ParE
MRTYTIKWAVLAVNHFRKLIEYIEKDSPQNALKVKKDLIDAIQSLTNNPEFYPPDKYKIQNTNHSFRAFELHRIRVSYFYNENEIIILRIRHTKQSPKTF